MLTRAITGLLFILTIMAGVYFNSIITLCLFTLIIVLGIDEFYSLVKKSKTIQPIKFWGILTGLVSIITIGLTIFKIVQFKIIFIPILMIFTIFLIELYQLQN